MKKEPQKPRVYGYVRASTSKQIASPETRRQIIEEYCRRHGRSLDHVYADAATSGKNSLFERTAGQELGTTLRKGDHVVVVRLDRLSRSFIGYARILDAWEKLGVTLHLCDMPGGGVMDPDSSTEGPVAESRVTPRGSGPSGTRPGRCGSGVPRIPCEACPSEPAPRPACSSHPRVRTGRPPGPSGR